MDLLNIGRFIAELRKEKDLTQEQLGDKIGVTNKTVSRWETGTYMPPADALLAMSELFGVSINEILSGKRLSAEEYKTAAEENLTETIRAGGFSLKERTDFFKKKWLKDHIAVMVIIGIIIVTVFVIGAVRRDSLIGSTAILLLVLAHGWRNNAMMTYAEKKAYSEDGAETLERGG